jgi:hypothetical protein
VYMLVTCLISFSIVVAALSSRLLLPVLLLLLFAVFLSFQMLLDFYTCKMSMREVLRHVMHAFPAAFPAVLRKQDVSRSPWSCHG